MSLLQQRFVFSRKLHKTKTKTVNQQNLAEETGHENIVCVEGEIYALF